MFLVPSQSLVGFGSSGGVDTQFEVLGPLPAGSWLRRLFVHVRTAGANTIDLAFSVGASSQANAGTLDAGRPLVSSAVPRVSQTPAIRSTSLGEDVRRFVLPVGFRLTAGSTFFVWGFDNTGGSSTQVVVGLEVLALQRVLGDKENVG